ncbi:Uma2 family endonuclease [Streptomyces orinoci]|uniref:Uma2 family endonuclease n=1 Tax=Streptomyces orinoci TaxID=67339 RepID=A0ABV3JTX5_STRON|nr:Uma2 family endonuclease [Streptomyces orinoci]
MTATRTDATGTADAGDELALDDLFNSLSVPEGYRVEIIGGNIFVCQQRDEHWQCIFQILCALEDRFGRDVVLLSDVRIECPGHLNGLCPDVVKVGDKAVKTERGRYRAEDVDFIAEVIAEETATNDYGPKKAIYAMAGVPAYLIADPYTRRCHLHTQPRDGEYRVETTVAFGLPVDLSDTPAQLILSTEDFLRD